MNPNIRRTVAWLNEYGFKTTDSGDGKTHDFRCDRPYSYIAIAVDPKSRIESEAATLRGLLEEWCVRVGPVSTNPTPQIQATFDPVTGIGLIELMHVDDSVLFGDKP